MYPSSSAVDLREQAQSSFEAQHGLRWYALETKPRQESLVDQRFRQIGIEVFLPLMRAWRRVGTKRVCVPEPLFPGYLFCRIDLIQSGKVVRYSPGVKDFVRFGTLIPELSDEFIEGFKQNCPGGIAAISPEFHTGERLLIKDGPLAGFQAIFQYKLKDHERIAVLLEFLGRQTTVVLPVHIVEKL
ncbi:MAG TPA: transcription termination/antitermination NusG family protein [Candidatus Eisenbacteria bacterium]|nr:transcription termination/antitermination NusG family protein [Candidatus Eisenbacteria bacterium]